MAGATSDALPVCGWRVSMSATLYGRAEALDELLTILRGNALTTVTGQAVMAPRQILDLLARGEPPRMSIAGRGGRWSPC